MKFTALTVAIFAAGAYARMAEPPTVYERDIVTITDILKSVGKGLDEISSAADHYSGDPQPLVKATQDVIKTIKDGKTKVDSSGDLSLTDALGLQDPVKKLQAKGEELVSNLKSKKSEIEAAGQCETARKLMTDMNTNSQALIKAVISKVPQAAQDIAERLAEGLQSALDAAQNLFSESNCKNTGGQSSSAAGSSSAAASSAATSAPASSAPASSPAGSSSAASSSSVADSSSAAGSYSAPATSAAATSAPYHTGGASTKYQSTGTGVPVVTAGAALIAPAGAIAAAIAAMVL